MEGLNSAFWIGFAFAIPFSVVGNLLTPKFQQWISKFSESAALKRAAVTQKERDRIASYIEKPHRLYVYLLSAIIAATFLGSVVGIFSGLFFLAGSFTTNQIMYAFGQFFAIFGGLLVAKICYDAIATIGKVKTSGG